MNDNLKLLICFVISILLMALLSPILKFIGAILGAIVGTLLIFFGISWLADKFHWKWW